LITSIWYEGTREILGSRYYNGVDGILGGRYEMIEYEKNVDGVYKNYKGNWVSWIMNEESDRREDLVFVDMGIEGENEFRQWFKESRYRGESFSDYRDNHIVLYWEVPKNIQVIRQWFKGHLGFFNEKAFEANRYCSRLTEVNAKLRDSQKTWGNIIRTYGGIDRFTLKYAGEHIINNLLKLLNKIH
jgi:hypothetical protein